MSARQADVRARDPGQPAKLGWRIAAIAALAGAAACTPAVWYDPALGVSAPEDVKRACRYAASDAAFSWPYAGWPAFGIRPYGWPYYDPWSPFGYPDTFLIEQQLFDYCMHVRGYRLVPARPADRAAL